MRPSKPISALWNGGQIWALLEGHPVDLHEQSVAAGLRECDGPPMLPTGSRRSVAPHDVLSLVGEFVAEVGVGIVHHAKPWSAPPRSERAAALAAAIKHELDPTGRLNPGVAL